MCSASKTKSQTRSQKYFTTGTIAVVKVGEEAVKHRVHKALLIQHSDYFCGALTGRFREAEEQSVTLDDVEPGVFTLFVHWLYTQTIPKSENDWNTLSILQDPNNPLERLQLWLKAYVFGDRILAPSFRRTANEASATIIPTCDIFNKSSRHLIRYAHDHVSSDRLIYQCLVNSFCAAWDDELPKGYALKGKGTLPGAFLWRVTMRFQELATMTLKERQRKLCYLEHVDGEEERCGKLHMRWEGGKGHGWFE